MMLCYFQSSLVRIILFLIITLTISLTFPIQAQNSRTYWQQEVNYTIHVKLDDVHHFLRGDISINYTNNSPDTLSHIPFHLWANAFKNNFTAFAKQNLENDSTAFYYAPDSMRGFIDSLNFEMNGLKAAFQYDSINPDIAKVNLPIPLYPGKKAVLYTTFRVKIPHTFSRPGHVRQQYQISQWYPKPAVYDRYGWHAFPYLDQGEFYSEFGSFNVHITLPKNYVVGATGVLQNKSEEAWLDKKAGDGAIKYSTSHSLNIPGKNTTPFPSSDPGTKTLHYMADDVHDFAWFADKRYEVMKSSVKLPHTNREVITWSMFLPESAPLWKDAVLYADSGIWYYSKWVGDYPYAQATVVAGSLGAGGGMEYPMITVIGEVNSRQQLEEVIVHEVGHNWFYGVLAFNEREHPWMDEGINSYYQYRYVETRYPSRGLLSDTRSFLAKLFDLQYPHHYESYLAYLFFARQRHDQSLNEKAPGFTLLNYAAMVYSKTAEVFRYLESYLGTMKYDSIMQQFFSEWKFKHPYPGDLKQVFEKNTNKELDWLFNQLLQTTDYLDYKLKKEEVGIKIGEKEYAQIKVKNKAQVRGPYSIAAYKDEKKVNELWYGGFNGSMDVLFPEGDYDYFMLDADHNLPETNRQNNYLRRKGLVKKMEPLRLQWFGSVDNPNRTQLFFTPLSGWNYYDEFTPGVALYNSLFFPKKINFILVPQYGVHSKDFVGIGAVNIPFYLRNSFIHAITFSSVAKSYTYGNTSNFGDTQSVDLRFIRLSQHLLFDLKKKTPRSSVNQKIGFKNIFLSLESPFTGINKNIDRVFNLITYTYDDNRVINPYHLEGGAELGSSGSNHYAKLHAMGDFIITYPNKKSGMDIRAFAGIFLSPDPPAIFDFHLSSTTGVDDYRFDRVFLGRSETTGFLARQITSNDDGGFKMRTTGLLTQVGASDTWIFSMNIKLPVPFFMPVFVFADGGLAPNDIYDLFQYDAGLGVTLLPQIIEVYLPLFFSQDIKMNINSTDFYNKWYKRITFSFNIDKLNPFELMRNFNP